MKVINKVFLILLVTLAASPLFAQSDLSIGSPTPETEIDTFVQKINGAGTLAATVQAADGGYVTTSKIDDSSVLVRKIKVSGQKQWERRLNFDTLDFTFASINGIAQTRDGAFVVAGQVCDEQSCGATLVKLRANGTVAWKKSLALFAGFAPEFSSVIATPDGGVIAIGTLDALYTRFIVVRFAATGDVVWGKNFGAFDTYYGPRLSFEVTADNGLILAFTHSFSRNDVDIMKITYSGTVVWEKLLKVDGFGFKSLGTTADNGLILVGIGTDSSKLKVIVLKADETLSWKAEYSLKVPSKFQSVSRPVQTPDGGYVVTGTTYDASARTSSGFIAKIDSSRNIAFQNTFVGRVAGAAFITADGGFLLFGSRAVGKSSDLLVLKVNSEGIVPGCSFFYTLGTTTRTPFGPLKIAPITTTTLDDLSLEPVNFGLTSVVTNHPVSTVCQ